MLKKIIIIAFSFFLLTLNANAGSDNELTINNNQTKETKDCFEN